MTRLLAKGSHHPSPATGRGQEDRTGALSNRNAGKSRRRRILAVLMMPALATVLTLLGTGAANASGTVYSASANCDSRYHTLQMQGTVLPPSSGGYVAIQFWVYSYQLGQWTSPSRWYYSPYEPPNSYYSIGIPATTVPSGQYYVEVKYAWYAGNGPWTYFWDTAPQFTQFQAPWSGGTPSATCFA